MPYALRRGWFKEAKEWMAHTGDKVPHCAWDERFEHPARTWASASNRAFMLHATGDGGGDGECDV